MAQQVSLATARPAPQTDLWNQLEIHFSKGTVLGTAQKDRQQQIFKKHKIYKINTRQKGNPPATRGASDGGSHAGEAGELGRGKCMLGGLAEGDSDEDGNAMQPYLVMNESI